MPALDVLTLKAQVLEDMANNSMWHTLMDNMVHSMKGNYTPEEKRKMWEVGHGAAMPNPMVTPDMTGAKLTANLRQMVEMGEAFYVAPTMHALVSAAAENLPDDTLVRVEDFPSLQGFMLIPGGITELDVRGKLVVTDVVTWDIYGGLVHLGLFTDKYNPIDKPTFTDEQRVTVPRLTPFHVQNLKAGQPIPRTHALFGMAIPPEVAEQISFTGDGDKMTVSWPIGYDLTADPQSRPNAVIAWLVAAVKLMKQTLVRTSDLKVDRNTRRRLERTRLVDNRATVIELRSRAGQYDRESGREYTHRFLRRGHWRRQWYGPVDSPERHQEDIYIHPTVVGDPSLPLLVREHVSALMR